MSRAQKVPSVVVLALCGVLVALFVAVAAGLYFVRSSAEAAGQLQACRAMCGTRGVAKFARNQCVAGRLDLAVECLCGNPIR